MKKNSFFLWIIFNLVACKSYQDLPTINQVDLKKYMGKWYEIARLPNRFEKDMECVTAQYRLKESGKIEVVNQGVTSKGKTKRAKGTAWIPCKEKPGRLKVSFFWPFAGDYYIIDLGEHYEYALVGNPSRKYLWILARGKTIKKELYTNLLKKAELLGFDSSKMLKISQECD